MHEHTLTSFRAALGNVDEATRRTVRQPRVARKPPPAERDFIGWRDPSAPQRGYLFTEHTGELTGIMLTTTRTRTNASRAVMCEFCRMPRRFEQVALFTAGSAQSKQQSTLGTYLCVDLDCNVRVNQLRPLTPLDPPADELVAQRRRELAERSAAFVTGVLSAVAASTRARSEAPRW